MSWTFPIPLGAAAAAVRRFLYGRGILLKVPPWLRRRVGGAVMSGIGDVVDDVNKRAAQAVTLRFPPADEGALAIQGEERGIVRGPTESAAAYAVRVQAWLGSHQRRGSVYAMLEQWHGYNGASPRRIDVIYASGTRYILSADGTIARDSITWDQGTGWASMTIVLYEPSDPGPLTPEQEQAYTVIPRTWKAGHVGQVDVALVWTETAPFAVLLWGYPPHDWGDVGLTWPAGSPIVLDV